MALALTAFLLLAFAYGLNLRSNALVFGDTDDAMRMVTVVDLLNGQAWHDMLQYRDNAPFGASIHWSRLIDLPIAAIILVAQPFLGAGAVEFAAAAWPLLLLPILLLLVLKLSQRLVPEADTLPALLLPLLSMLVLVEFAPGRVDHHNVQMLLTLGMALSLLESRSRPAWGLVGGILCATSLAIGMETLPFVILAVALHAVLWAHDPMAREKATLLFALAFPSASLLHFAAATTPSLYFAPACDALSVPYVLGATLAGLALLGAVLAGRRLATPGVRLALAAVLGAAAATTVVMVFPACLSGPYSMLPPDLAADYFSAIPEAQPLFARFLDRPAFVLGCALVPLAALLVAGREAIRERGQTRLDWLVLFAFLLVAVGMMLLQIRGARLAVALALPAAALVITRARAAYLFRPRPVGALRLVGSWLLFASMLHFLVFDALASLMSPVQAAPMQPVAAEHSSVDASRLTCIDGGTYAELALLPKAAIAAPQRLGARILYYTPHSVIAAGFHRNVAGIVDNEIVFTGPEAQARSILEARGIDYLVVCSYLPVARPAKGVDSTSFAALASEARTWSWLVPVSSPGAALKIFRVVR